MKVHRVLAAGLAGAVTLAAGAASAHEFRPALLDVTDLGGGRYEILWKGPAAGGEAPRGPAPELALPPECRPEPGEGPMVVSCGPEGLAGRSITVRGLGAMHADALVRFTGPGGPTTAVLREGASTFVVPSPAGRGVHEGGSALARARGYLGAGVDHIARGVDHLLFVLGLLLLVLGSRPGLRAALPALFGTVTAFTLAHSVTLALAATAAVRLPPAPVEAVIALSLVLLAGELARGRSAGDEPSLARRRPALLAFAFGLLHGFGFAGGLAELRVPAGDLPLALAGFNLGVEAGQLAFVAVCLGAVALLRRARGIPRLAALSRLSLAPAYLIGSLGAFFCVERVLRFWSS